MLRLERPQHTARATFETCISRVRNPALKARLNAATQTVADASAAFDDAAERRALHEVLRDAVVAPDITTEEMEKVYTQRMAKEDAPGRDIYDDIFDAPLHGRCPLCAHRMVATLDHHLPKAHYPALAVTPLNLVPSCTDCNKAKLGAVPRTVVDAALHPYYDDIDEHRWLTARVVETRPAAVRFQISPPDEWDDVLTARVRNHFRTLGLRALYASEAAEELVSVRHQFVNMLAHGGVDDVRKELGNRAVSCAVGRRNSWRSATYHAWVDSNWFCNGGFAFEG